jgi:phospholipid transport system substrate-binding protein
MVWPCFPVTIVRAQRNEAHKNNSINLYIQVLSMQTQAKKTSGKIQILFVALFSLLCLSQNSLANTQAVSDPADPAYIIHTALAKIITFSSSSDKVSPMQLRGFIENEIIPHFDFNNMSHWITGRYANDMSAQDKEDFQRKLRETFLTSLAKHLGSFDSKNTRIRFSRARYRGPNEAFVSTTVYRTDTPSVRLDFRMKREDKDWKIIDVKANGSSAVLYYRRHFMSELREFQRNSRPYRQYR